MLTLTSIEHDSKSSTLISSDYVNLIGERGLHADWVLKNIERITKDEATKRLGYPAQSDGLWLQGYGEYGQFKPDGLHIDKKGKPAKYITPKKWGVLFPTHPLDPTYWSDLEALKRCCFTIDGQPYVLLTEGFYKAIAGCSNGLPTLALLGVDMGLTKKDTSGNRHLLPELKAIADAGIGFIIAFDADVATNKRVKSALKTLKNAIITANAPVIDATGMWNEKDGKGMDDFIKNNGADAFKELIQQAAIRNQLEKMLPATIDNESTFDKKKNKSVNSKEVSLELLTQFEDRYSYHQEHQTWREYNGKTWVSLTDLDFLKIVDESIEALGNLNYEIHHVRSVETFLRLNLLIKKWEPLPQNKFIPFDDCIYDIDNATVLEHKPEYRLLNCLPYKFNPIATNDSVTNLLQQHCPNICNWLKFAMDNSDLKIEKILAITNAIIKCEFSNLQMFVHLVGEPGAGKGTLIRLWQLMLGKDNFHSSNLSALSDPYSSSSFVDKMLLCFPDERDKISIAHILRLTSGKDGINVRRMRKEPTSASFTGSVVMASNSSVFIGDTTGKERRYCSIHFNNAIPKVQRDERIFSKFESELPALMNIALSMNSARVVELIKGINDAEIPENTYQNWLLSVQENSICNFIEECIIYRPNAENIVRLGDNKTVGNNILYYVYHDSCERAGLKAVSKNRFKDEFIRQCKELGWNIEHKYNGKNQSCVIGEVELRGEGTHEDIPTYSQQLLAELNNNNLTTPINEPKEPPKEPAPEPPKVEPPTEQKRKPPKEPIKPSATNELKSEKQQQTPKKVNVNSLVHVKDDRYPDIYKVVGGNGKTWQVENVVYPAKNKADFITFATNNLTVVNEYGKPIDELGNVITS